MVPSQYIYIYIYNSNPKLIYLVTITTEERTLFKNNNNHMKNSSTQQLSKKIYQPIYFSQVRCIYVTCDIQVKLIEQRDQNFHLQCLCVCVCVYIYIYI